MRRPTGDARSARCDAKRWRSSHTHTFHICPPPALRITLVAEATPTRPPPAAQRWYLPRCEKPNALRREAITTAHWHVAPSPSEPPQLASPGLRGARSSTALTETSRWSVGSASVWRARQCGGRGSEGRGSSGRRTPGTCSSLSSSHRSRAVQPPRWPPWSPCCRDCLSCPTHSWRRPRASRHALSPAPLNRAAHASQPAPPSRARAARSRG